MKTIKTRWGRLVIGWQDGKFSCKFLRDYRMTAKLGTFGYRVQN